jgi:outer membrane lipoprotein SlyB
MRYFHFKDFLRPESQETVPMSDTPPANTTKRPRNACFATLLFAAAFSITGCATSPTTANTVSRHETGRVHTFERGEIIYVRSVTIEGESDGIGALAGGAMELALGNAVGGGRGQTIARVGGAIAGAGIGTAMEQAATTTAGVELSILLESGEMIVVIQAADERFDKGDSVRVIRRADGGVRVVQ